MTNKKLDFFFLPLYDGGGDGGFVGIWIRITRDYFRDVTDVNVDKYIL